MLAGALNQDVGICHRWKTLPKRSILAACGHSGQVERRHNLTPLRLPLPKHGSAYWIIRSTLSPNANSPAKAGNARPFGKTRQYSLTILRRKILTIVSIVAEKEIVGRRNT